MIVPEENMYDTNCIENKNTYKQIKIFIYIYIYENEWADDGSCAKIPCQKMHNLQIQSAERPRPEVGRSPSMKWSLLQTSLPCVQHEDQPFSRHWPAI